MALSSDAARLTEAHRLAQSRLGAQTTRQLLDLWTLLDPGAIDDTLDVWLRAAVAQIRAQRLISARLASGYLTAFRTLEAGAPVVPVLAETIPAEQVTTSLLVTGPYRLRRAMSLKRPDAVRDAGVSQARAGMRHALNGGRDTIHDTVRSDKDALGWARATSGRACHFCAMLASRGPVYSKTTVGFQCHDGCHCYPEPVYHRDAPWPPGSREYQELWQQTTRGLSGDAARQAFREALNAA